MKSVAKFSKYYIGEFEDMNDIDYLDKDNVSEKDDQMTVDLS